MLIFSESVPIFFEHLQLRFSDPAYLMSTEEEDRPARIIFVCIEYHYSTRSLLSQECFLVPEYCSLSGERSRFVLASRETRASWQKQDLHDEMEICSLSHALPHPELSKGASLLARL